MGGFEKSFSMQFEMNKIIVNIDQAVKSYRDLDYTEKIPPHPPEAVNKSKAQSQDGGISEKM